MIVRNYGIAIILFTIITKVLMFPFSVKQQKSTAAQGKIAQKQKELQQKYANNKAKYNEELQALYQKEGVSTMSGCLPLIIQLPIIYGLFALLRNPLTYMKAGSMIAAVHESFLWIPDLSQPDAWLLPIIAAITTYFTSEVNMGGSQAAGGGMMASMKYLMPIMIFLMGRSFPAGLALYWTIGNLVMILQAFIFKRKDNKKKAMEEAEAEVLKRMKKENTR